MKKNVESKSSDDKNIEVKPKKDNLMTQPVDVGKKKGQPNPSENGSLKVKLVGKSSKPANGKEIVTRSKSKNSESEVASLNEGENSKSSRSEQSIRNVGSNDEKPGTRKEVDEDSSFKNITDKATPEISSQPIIRRTSSKLVKLEKGDGKTAETCNSIAHKDNDPTSSKNTAPKVSDASSRKRTVTNVSDKDVNETNDKEGEDSNSKKKKPNKITQKKGVSNVKKPNKDTEEDKDDSKDFVPKRRKSIDSDTSKVPKKKLKNNKDIHEYVTRSNEKSKSQDKKGKEKSTNKSAADTKSSEREIEGTEERNVSDEVEEDSGFNCPFCKKTYKNYVNFKVHKIICGSKGKKVSCLKCGKGFKAKNLMEQHFDYMHTNKPKRFVCKIHNKAFELKKTLNKHNMCLHNTVSYKFQCDICG